MLNFEKIGFGTEFVQTVNKKYNMKFYTFFASLLITLVCTAQPPSYDNLKILYADEDFEKLVDKALKYTDKDDTKKDPVPYMWAAKGLYKMSIAGIESNDHNKPFKEALKYIGKSFKYDEDGACVEEHKVFVEEFMLSAVTRIVNDCQADDYRKAFGWNIKYLKISPNPVGALYMDAVCKFRNSDRGGANTSWKEADEQLESITSIEGWMEADKILFMHGIIETAKIHIDSRKKEKAIDLLNRFAPWYENMDEFKSFYDQTVNS